LESEIQRKIQSSRTIELHANYLPCAMMVMNNKFKNCRIHLCCN